MSIPNSLIKTDQVSQSHPQSRLKYNEESFVLSSFTKVQNRRLSHVKSVAVFLHFDKRLQNATDYARCQEEIAYVQCNTEYNTQLCRWFYKCKCQKLVKN